jgi:hypothetical protein
MRVHVPPHIVNPMVMTAARNVCVKAFVMPCFFLFLPISSYFFPTAPRESQG